VSLVIEEALALRTELASPIEAGVLRKGIDTADIDEAEEASPARR
jgi:hypothetical protein